MRRVTLIAGAVCLAVLASTGAYTQVPPDTNNPLEAVPDAVTFTPYGEPISLENAKKVAAAAAAEVAKRNWRGAFCISVADTSGELVYFERGENCQFASIAISQHKARTAARYRRATVVFERLLGKGPYYAYLPTLDDFTGSRGGNPIIVGGKIVGAIGVSGGTGSQDDVVSQAGAGALK